MVPLMALQQGQGIVERSHAVLKKLLNKLKHGSTFDLIHKTPHNWLHHALYVLNFLTLDVNGLSAADRFWHPQDKAVAKVWWKDTLSNQWHGPDPVLIWGRGHVCVFPRSADAPVWVPEHLVKHGPVPGWHPSSDSSLSLAIPDATAVTETQMKPEDATNTALSLPADMDSIESS
ncbi:Gag-Pro-Pol polyprotein [Plecturocebus cupreus]